MRDVVIKEGVSHVISFLSNNNQTHNKYYTIRLKDGWTVFYESSSLDGNDKTVKMYIPDELYDIFTADIAIKSLSD